MTFWLLVLLGLFLVWLALEPRQSQRVVQVSEGIWARLPFVKRGPSISPDRVRVVVLDAAHATDATGGAASPAELENFAVWIEGMGAAELKEFAKQLNASLRAEKISLLWATDGGSNGTTYHALQEVVLFHALALWRARALAPLAQLQTYLANPNARGNRAFAQKVYAKLAKVDPSILDANMMMASDKERSKYVHAAIEKAARANQDRVVNVVRDVMNEAQPKKKTPAPAPVPMIVETKVIPPSTGSEA